MTKTKKPLPTFEVGFEDVYPEMISLSVLSRVLSAVRRLAAGLDGSDEAGAATLEGEIGLLQVKRGSAIYLFKAPPQAVGYLRIAGQVLERPETIGERDYILSPVEELSAVAKSLDCPIVVREPGKEGMVLARIEPASYATISQRLLISGESAITGRVVRVGGAIEKKCGLRIPDQSRMLICKVDSVEAARSLGQRLYEDIAAHGTATWLKTNWKIVAFTVKEVFQPKLKSVKETMEALRRAGGKSWDDIDDPAAFIEEVGGKP